MPAIARIGDHISHGGVIVSGSSNVFANNKSVARATIDGALCLVHGLQLITTGSPNVFCNGYPVARVGDLIACGAVITDGSPNVFINGD